MNGARRIRFRHRDGSSVVETDVIISQAEDWPTMAEAASPEWATCRIGRRLLALRLDPSLRRYVDPAESAESGGRPVVG